MVSSSPDQPSSVTSASSVSDPVKVATPDIILFKDELLPIEIMTDLIFENIGGQELINITRNDIINGQDVIYQPIKNLTSIQLQYNPQNILALQDTDKSYFANFPINLSYYLTEEGTGPNGEPYYIDTNGDLVVNVINANKDEQVEIQIFTQGEFIDATIY